MDDNDMPMARNKRELRKLKDFTKALQSAQSSKKETLTLNINAAAQIATALASRSGVKHVVQRVIMASKEPKTQKATAVYVTDSIMKHVSRRADEDLLRLYENRFQSHLQKFFKRALRMEATRYTLAERFLKKIIKPWKAKGWFGDDIEDLKNLIYETVPELNRDYGDSLVKGEEFDEAADGGDDGGGHDESAPKRLRGATAKAGCPATPMQPMFLGGLSTPRPVMMPGTPGPVFPKAAGNSAILRSLPSTPKFDDLYARIPATPKNELESRIPMTPAAGTPAAMTPGAFAGTPAALTPGAFACSTPGFQAGTPGHRSSPGTPAFQPFTPGMLGPPRGSAQPFTPGGVGGAPGTPRGASAQPFTPGRPMAAPFTPAAAPFTPGMAGGFAAPFTPGMPAAQPFTPGGPAVPFTPGANPLHSTMVPGTPRAAMPFTPVGAVPFTPGAAGAVPMTPRGVAPPSTPGGIGRSAPVTPAFSGVKRPAPGTPAFVPVSGGDTAPKTPAGMMAPRTPAGMTPTLPLAEDGADGAAADKFHGNANAVPGTP